MTSGFYDQILRARTDGTIVVGFNTFGYRPASKRLNRCHSSLSRPNL